ncbi:MAG: adenylate/guanylate cyclase domain-containing protein [Rhizobiaceae bacterium]|nr:adenylate/guanylate cyclase domain-containing protein [Hyphomicrobiales bacterium]NRB31744.1 adenylate/guanylate cyclase domain-containing protein [Rhizobiaceae bacterium]
MTSPRGQVSLRQEQGQYRPTGRKFSITFTLAASIGGLVAIAVFAELILGFSAGRRNTFALLNEKAIFLVDKIETAMRHHLDPAEEIVTNFKAMIESGAVNPDDQKQISTAAMGMVAAERQIWAVGYWTADLQQTLALRTPGQDLLLVQEDHKADPQFNDLLQDVRSIDEAIWRELAFAEGVTLVNVVQAVRRDEKFIGFVGAVVTMPELSSLITEVGDTFNATGFILYGPEGVLAHPNLVSPHPDLSKETPIVSRARVGDLVLANFQNRQPTEGFEPAAEQGVQVDSLDQFDTQHVLFTRGINDYGAVPWIIGAHVPASNVNAELLRMLIAALAGIAVLVLSIVAAVLLGRRIARPIKQASETAVQISGLNFSAADTLSSSYIRELDDQARAFNSMVQGLKWFETYVPKKLVSQLMRDGSFAASAERELTVMFTDIVGFTSLSESMPATEVAGLLNEHFAILGKAIEQEGGTIDKFIGDSVMAFWGAPEPQTDHAARAIKAAQTIANQLEAENERRAIGGKVAVRIRIGLHTGPVVIGNIGAPGRINYTIVGDTVNTAQRIEVLGKEFDQGSAATVLMTAATRRSAGNEAKGASAGEFEVKGKNELIEVIRVSV